MAWWSIPTPTGPRFEEAGASPHPQAVLADFISAVTLPNAVAVTLALADVQTMNDVRQAAVDRSNGRTSPGQRQALDRAASRLSAVHQRKRAEVVALPIPALRTPLQRGIAREAIDWLLLVRCVLIIAGKDTPDDLVDGGVGE